MFMKNMGMVRSNQICRESPPHFSLKFLKPDICAPGSTMTVVCGCTVPQLEFVRICYSTSLLFFLRRRPLSFTVCYRSTLLDCARYSSPTDFFHGVVTPDRCWGSSFECVIVSLSLSLSFGCRERQRALLTTTMSRSCRECFLGAISLPH